MYSRHSHSNQKVFNYFALSSDQLSSALVSPV